MPDKRPIKPSFDAKIGYTRKEFNAIFQLYSQNVYTGLFKDFSFSDVNGKYFISFREEAGKTPLVTIEKKKLSANRVIFIATSLELNNKGQKIIKEIAKSEKIDSFIRQLRGKIEILRSVKGRKDESSSAK